MRLGKKNNQKELEELIRKLKSDNQQLKLKLSDSEKDKLTQSVSEKLLQRIVNNNLAILLVFNSSDKTFESKYISENIVFPQINKLDDFLNLIHPDDEKKAGNFFNKLPEYKKEKECKFKLIRIEKDAKETKTYRVKLLKINDKTDPNKIFLLFKDISNQISKKKEILKIKQKAKESEILKTVFLANISHHIRTPMNSILGFAEILTISDPGREKRKEILHIIRNQSKSLLNLIDDISEITKFETKKQTLSKSPCNLNLLLNEIHLAINEQRTGKSKEEVELKFIRPSEEGIEIFTDTGRLYQIIYNILSYSSKHTTSGHIHFGYEIPVNGFVKFFIKDTSPGLTKKECKVLFHRYTNIKISDNTKMEEPALGLTVASYIVKLFGGKIWVESEPSLGIQFYFTIKYEKVPHTDTIEIEEEIDELMQYDWRNRVILIVEDEEVNSMFMEAILQETNVQMIYAKTGIEAVELCRTLPKLDLILMDIKMPVMDGLKATQKIREFNTKIPIIAQTAMVSEDDKKNAMNAGCNEVITKPIEVQELLKRIHFYLSE